MSFLRKIFFSVIALLEAAVSTDPRAESHYSVQLENMSCHNCGQSDLLGPVRVQDQQGVQKFVHKVNIFGRDDRIKQTRLGPGNPFAAIGMVVTVRKTFTDDKGKAIRDRGTAFMVSPCLAVTNYHAIFRETPSDDVIPYVLQLMEQMASIREKGSLSGFTLSEEKNYAMILSIGENPDGTFKYRVVGIPVAFGEDKDDVVGKDWAVIRFEPPNCPGEDPEIGWLEFATLSTDELLQIQVYSAGYPGDLISGASNSAPLYRTGACRLREFLNGRAAFAHDCAAKPGQSGSPVLATIDRQPKVVAIFSEELTRAQSILPSYDPGSSYSRNSANIAVDIRYFYPGIRRRIEADIVEYYRRRSPKN
jgi:V8-like Glu-specific endopeptidase